MGNTGARIDYCLHNSADKYLLSTFYVQRIVLGYEIYRFIAVNKTDRVVFSLMKFIV